MSAIQCLAFCLVTTTVQSEVPLSAGSAAAAVREVELTDYAGEGLPDYIGCARGEDHSWYENLSLFAGLDGSKQP